MAGNIPLPIPVREVAERYRAGKSVKSLCAHYGCCRNTIFRRIAAGGAQRRAPYQSIRHAHAELIKLYNSGMKVEAIGRKLGINSSSVSDIALQLGCARRRTIRTDPTRYQRALDLRNAGATWASIAAEMGASTRAVRDWAKKASEGA